MLAPTEVHVECSGLAVRWLPYGELEKNRSAMARFGTGLKAIEAIARAIG